VSRSKKNEAKKPKLRIVTTKPEVRLGGALPTSEMAPGKYLAMCENAWLERVGRKYRAVVQFRIVNGKYDGIAVRMWIDNAADAGGFVSPVGKYAQTCAVALGRPVEEGDPLDEPGEFFSGRRFLVFVGYRKSERAGGGGQSSDERAMIKKDDDDYLRVHEIISREDLL